MRSRLLFLLPLLLTCSLQAQKGIINKGALIVVSGNAMITAQGSGASYTNLSEASVPGRISLNGKFYLQGDWLNNAGGGTVFINPSNTGEVIFQGNSAQVVGGNQPTIFGKMTINNPSGVFLNNTITLEGDLLLGAGILHLGDDHLVLGNWSAIGGIPSAEAMVVTDGTGELRKKFDAPGSFLFPVGDNTDIPEYSPVQVHFTGGSFAGDASASVRVINAKHPLNSSTVNYLTRYWSLSQNGISDFTAEVLFVYTDADLQGNESLLYGGQYTAPVWKKLNAVNTADNTFTASVNTFSDFTAGESSAFAVTIVPGEEASFRIYAWRNFIIVSTDDPEKNGPYIGVYNVAGQLVGTHTLQKERINRIATYLPEGIYFVRMAGKDRVYTVRLFLTEK